jgi:hypothetical protein
LKDADFWGELPGATGEDIIVFSHHDGYFQAASDNASGMAVMMALAERYARMQQAQRRRTLKFVTTSGHHAGSLGVRWMHDNRETFLARTALMINAEHASPLQLMIWEVEMRQSTGIQPRRWFVHGSSKLAAPRRYRQRSGSNAGSICQPLRSLTSRASAIPSSGAWSAESRIAAPSSMRDADMPASPAEPTTGSVSRSVYSMMTCCGRSEFPIANITAAVRTISRPCRSRASPGATVTDGGGAPVETVTVRPLTTPVPCSAWWWRRRIPIEYCCSSWKSAALSCCPSK